MCKKLILAGAAVLLVGGLVFGGKIMPYAQTAIEQVRETAEEAVPIEFQIESARNQLEQIRPEIHDMVHQIAKEKAEIKQLHAELDRSSDTLEQSREEMMTLRQHLDSGDQVYVAINGNAYTNDRVEEDLRHRFSVYQTNEATRDKQMQILELREQALTAALEQLDQAKAMERELQVQIENLNARNAMVQVAEQASNLDLDDSQLARTREMLDDISVRLDTREELLNMAPEYFGQIPVSEDSIPTEGDIASEIDAYFGVDASADDFVNN